MRSGSPQLTAYPLAVTFRYQSMLFQIHPNGISPLYPTYPQAVEDAAYRP